MRSRTQQGFLSGDPLFPSLAQKIALAFHLVGRRTKQASAQNGRVWIHPILLAVKPRPGAEYPHRPLQAELEAQQGEV